MAAPWSTPPHAGELKTMDSHISRLRQQVEAAELQLRNLKGQLHQAELEAEASRQVAEMYRGGVPAEWIGEVFSALHNTDRDAMVPSILHSAGETDAMTPASSECSRWPLNAVEFQRYGRQMIMPEVGLHGQLRLRGAKVLIVGVGGLGCPAAAYLAGAGVGTLGLIDGDSVEVSNLHRQVAHGTARVGMSKVDSACEYLQSLNPEVNYVRHTHHLSPDQAVTIFEQYDIVLDCTDHPTSRYLISDACVLTGKPLVSASALKTEGQLLILNDEAKPAGDNSGGPCYRCIFPKPPPPDSVLSCGEGGILGPVVGVMGVLQALEAIKLITRKPKMSKPILSLDDAIEQGEPARPTMLLFSAYSNPQFRSVRLRSRRPDCAVCSANAVINKQSLTTGSMDYVAFCGRTLPVDVLPPESRIRAGDFAKLPRDASNILIDTRDETQYAICALRGSVNVPWQPNASMWIADAWQRGVLNDNQQQKFVVCRNGNDSQLAVKAIMDWTGVFTEVRDIKGGFKAWREEVDGSWPDY